MSKSERPIYKAWFGETELKESIFPTFNVNVPMPSGTAVPAAGVVPPMPAGGTTADSADTATGPTKQG